jgi:hypothetical protein
MAFASFDALGFPSPPKRSKDPHHNTWYHICSIIYTHYFYWINGLITFHLLNFSSVATFPIIPNKKHKSNLDGGKLKWLKIAF